jgi:hypothetical protein
MLPALVEPPLTKIAAAVVVAVLSVMPETPKLEVLKPSTPTLEELEP